MKVSVFEREAPQSMLLKAAQGGARVFGGGKLLVELRANDLLFVTITRGQVRVRTIERLLGTYSRVLVRSKGDTGTFSLQGVKPTSLARAYAGSVSFSGTGGRIRSILEIDFERYVAGVVEAEVGARQALEMYKVQAIIARTYALENLSKHALDRFNLCDNTHCQAFKGISISNPDIVEACKSTQGLVVADGNNAMISAVFHANCGGQTVNSEDIWPKYKSYLRSVSCPYCSSSQSFGWRAGISLQKWKDYAKSSASDTGRFDQANRKVYVTIGGREVMLHRMRQDLGFRSAFFSFKQVGDSVIFTGKGYGHGVGLCQDGAASMARLGMTYQQIISFYYRGCQVVDLVQTHPEQVDDEFFGDNTSGGVGVVEELKK